ILEGMAQTGGIMLLNSEENPEDKILYFSGLDNVRFRRTVLPGSQLIYELELIKKRSTSVKMQGRAFVDGEMVAEADMMAAIIDRKRS
ncbi:MAG: UDP-3-O-[3-hydroxymyristoyl] N-acetylglucosamine deacetylase, partial [Calditrichaeota bacterium]